jgi:REP element-mobilizing transposase RayT
MPRRPRIHYPGAVYHVTARGVDKRQIFFDPEDYRRYTNAQTAAVAELGGRLIAHCLMPNHIHLAVKIGSIPLSRIMHRILGPYAGTFNEKYRRVGHLFQGRHSAYLVTHERHLQNLIRYIHQNPVRAKLVTHPKDWTWSSCSDDPRETDSIPNDFDPFFGASNEDEPPLLRQETPPRESLERIGEGVQSRSGIPLRELRSAAKRAKVVAAKTEFAAYAAAAGYSVSETARWLGVSPTAVANYLSKR